MHVFGKAGLLKFEAELIIKLIMPYEMKSCWKGKVCVGTHISCSCLSEKFWHKKFMQ